MNNNEHLISLITDFEKKILEAFTEKYKDLKAPAKKSLLENHPVQSLNIYNFYEIYSIQTIYPHDRSNKLIHLLFDIKLQLYFISEVDLGLYNLLIFSADDSVRNNPYTLLKKLSLDQNLIVKSRILWERIMNFIYYLEQGTDIPENNKRSKKTTFFNFITTNKWHYLTYYKDFILWYDEKLRTPEVHAGSVLRKKLQLNNVSSDEVDEKILGIVNIVMNVFYQNLLIIIRGGTIRSQFWESAMTGIVDRPRN